MCPIPHRAWFQGAPSPSLPYGKHYPSPPTSPKKKKVVAVWLMQRCSFPIFSRCCATDKVGRKRSSRPTEARQAGAVFFKREGMQSQEAKLHARGRALAIGPDTSGSC